MTNWQRYAEAMDASLAKEIEAARAATKECAVAAAEAALGECSRALDLELSPAAERFARERGERLAADLVSYQERGAETWPPSRDAESVARFGEALGAGLDHGRDALKPESREEAAGLYAKAAQRLAEAAVAARDGSGEEVARVSHKYAAGQVERVADPKEWPMPSEIKAMRQKLDREDAEERRRRPERKGFSGFAR